MASHVKYFPPVDEVHVISQTPLSAERAAERLRIFVEQDASVHNVPNESIHQLREVYASLNHKQPQNADNDADGE